MSARREPVIVVGAGLAGLACARALQAAGQACVVLEASDGVGGRVRTDAVDGFLLDRGFQVLLTAYPEARVLLDYETLALRPLAAGARVRWKGEWHTVADPRRHPGLIGATLAAPFVTWADGVRVLRWALAARGRRGDGVLRRPETTARVGLAEKGFSAGMVEAFLRPWLSGIFLEGELATSSRMLEFVWGMFARGRVAVPAAGMGAIATQLADGLGAGTVRLNTGVRDVARDGVRLVDGSWMVASEVVVATDASTAAAWSGGGEKPRWRGTTCVYFDAPASPGGGGFLHLGGDRGGVVNHAVVMSDVAPSYAPEGRALVAANLVGSTVGDDGELEGMVRAELAKWWPSAAVAKWRHLRTYRISRALPVRWPLEVREPRRAAGGWWVAGDHVATASIDGAMRSGREVAAALQRDVS